MSLHHITKFAHRTSSALIFTGFMASALTFSMLTNADPASSPSTEKGMSMDHMDMNHKHMKMTGNQDYDFAMMMKMHHEKGVKMAQKELDKGKDPEMRAAAQKIIDAQKKEIADFDKWLADHPQKAK